MKKAKYQKTQIEGFDGNPMIEAIVGNIAMSKEEIARRLYKSIEWDSDFSSCTKIESALRIKEIRNIFIPLKIHLNLYEELSYMLLQSYIARNPIDSEFIRKSNKRILGNSNSTREFRTLLLTGSSGLGKSYSVDAVIESIGIEGILHTKYEGRQLSIIQIPFVKVNMDFTGSIKALILGILKEVDAKAETSYYSESVSKRYTNATLTNMLSMIVYNHQIGCIIIDELQMVKNISKLTSFLTDIINKISTSFLFIATPDLYQRLDDFAVRRRLSTEGHIEIEEMNYAEYSFFLSELFGYQVGKAHLDLTDVTLEYMYNSTGGNTDLSFKLYLKVLQVQLDKGLKKISLSDIEDVYRSEFKLLTEEVSEFKGKRNAMMTFQEPKEISCVKNENKLNDSRVKEINIPNEDYKSYKDKMMIQNLEWCL